MNNKKILIEGSVIVVSILLAFGIDAMWDEYKERLGEQEILAALKTEFEASMNELNGVLEFHLNARDSMDELFSSSDDEIRKLDQQKRSQFVMDMCNPWSFYPVIGTTNALIGAGELDILEERQLREALTAFLTLVEDSIEDIEYVGHDAERVWVAEIDVGGPWTDRSTEIGLAGEVVKAPVFIPKPTTEDVLRIRNDPKLKGLIARCHINIGYYIVELERLKAGAQRVLDLIAESD